jgi:hypothetical protein
MSGAAGVEKGGKEGGCGGKTESALFCSRKGHGALGRGVMLVTMAPWPGAPWCHALPAWQVSVDKYGALDQGVV